MVEGLHLGGRDWARNTSCAVVMRSMCLDVVLMFVDLGTNIQDRLWRFQPYASASSYTIIFAISFIAIG